MDSGFCGFSVMTWLSDCDSILSYNTHQITVNATTKFEAHKWTANHDTTPDTDRDVSYTWNHFVIASSIS